MFLRIPFIVFTFATLAISVALKIPMQPELSSGIDNSALIAHKTQATTQPIPSQAPTLSMTPRVASVKTTDYITPSAIPYMFDWSASTPSYAQGQLLGGFACAPTSVAMITAHFHALDPRLGVRSPEEMVAHLQPGEFVSGHGVPFEDLSSQLSDMGYSLRGVPGLSQADLVQAMSAGPVIALVDRDITGRRGPHAVVVVAITKDGSRVMVNDPATGDRATLTWKSFETMWSGGNHWVVLIRPL